MSKIKETTFENVKIVTYDFSQELHDKVVEMVKDDPFWYMQYDFEEIDPEVVNVWISDAYSEGDEEYVNFLRNTIIDGGTLYTLIEGFGDVKKPVGEVAVYIYDDNKDEVDKEKLHQDVENVIYDMFSDWDISDAGELCCNIIDEVCDDVIETSDYPEYNDSDIRIAVKRTIINLTSIGK